MKITNDQNNIDNLMNDIYKKYKLKIFSEKEILKVLTFTNETTYVITDYIINYFHEKLRNNMKNINEQLLSIMRSHIKEHKSLFWKLHKLFGEITTLYESHLILEEELIFNSMISLDKNKISKESEEYKKMISSINESENEHSVGDSILEELYLTTNGYTLPQHACEKVKILYEHLRKFQDNLIAHTELENLILFPRYLK